KWWRGLDSNQRTLARADLQSAAFNHSATSPQRLFTRHPHQRVAGVAIGQARHVAARPCRVNASEPEELSPLHCVRASKIKPSPRWPNFGAGEGNRTLVVSLEGFCSTIELHPLAGRPMPLPQR